MKKYRFKYYNTTFKLLSVFLIPFINIIIVSIVISVLTKLLYSFGLCNLFSEYKIMNYCQNAIIIISAIWNLVYILFPKGVFLYEDHMVISRYCISLRNVKLRIKVYYKDVKDFKVNYNNLLLSKYYGAELVPFGDNNYNVELTLKNNKKLFFSIYDAEMFIEELKKKYTDH